MCADGTWKSHTKEYYEVGIRDIVTGTSYSFIFLISTVSFEDLATMVSVCSKSNLTVINHSRSVLLLS